MVAVRPMSDLFSVFHRFLTQPSWAWASVLGVPSLQDNCFAGAAGRAVAVTFLLAGTGRRRPRERPAPSCAINKWSGYTHVMDRRTNRRAGAPAPVPSERRACLFLFCGRPPQSCVTGGSCMECLSGRTNHIFAIGRKDEGRLCMGISFVAKGSIEQLTFRKVSLLVWGFFLLLRSFPYHPFPSFLPDVVCTTTCPFPSSPFFEILSRISS